MVEEPTGLLVVELNRDILRVVKESTLVILGVDSMRFRAAWDCLFGGWSLSDFLVVHFLDGKSTSTGAEELRASWTDPDANRSLLSAFFSGSNQGNWVTTFDVG